MVEPYSMRRPLLARLAAGLRHGGAYALALLMPLSVFVPLAPPAAPDVLPVYVTPGLYLADIPLAALLLGTLLAQGGSQGRPRWLPLLLPLALLGLLTAPLALAPPLAFYTATRWLLAVALYLCLSQSEVPTRRLIALFLVGLCLQALVGLAQAVQQGPLGLPGELAIPPHLSGSSIIEVGRGRWMRAYGLTFHPNVLGGFLAVGLLVGLPWLKRATAHWLALWWLLWAGLFVTFSRAAWVAVALMLPLALLWLLWRHPAMRRSLAVALLGVVGVGVLVTLAWPNQVLVRWQSVMVRFQGGSAAPNAPLTPQTERWSLDTRAELNRLAGDFIAQHPYTGVGAGNFPLAMIAAGSPVAPQFVHNMPLLFAAEVTGLGGVLWVVLGLGAAGRLLWRRRTIGPWEGATLCAWLALWVIGMADSYPWALNEGRLLAVFLLALSDRLAAEEAAEGIALPHPRP